MKRILTCILSSLLAGAALLSSAAPRPWLRIENDRFWDTADGQPIFSQGGGIFQFADPATGEKRYYWYGVEYEECAKYRENPSVTLPNATFRNVTCYSSTDLVNWRFEANVMTPAEAFADGRRTWVGRLGVAYIPEVNKYAMVVQNGSLVMIALSDSPTGTFTEHQKINMTSRIGTSNTGDQTVFTDYDTGKSYLICSYGRGRNKAYVAEIGLCDDGKVGLKNCIEVFRGAGREGNCMFKYKGRYYLCASNLYGWDCSYAYYLVADSIYGPYLPVNDMQVMPGCGYDFAHVTQTGFFFTLKGSKQETVIYCGDRWCDFAGNGLGYNQWVPLSFGSDGRTPHFNSLNAWELNPVTGEWRVARDNNYVLNGSFEADRRPIPEAAKPRQDTLIGWNTLVVKGSIVSADEKDTPFLNYLNTEGDRHYVIGEKSLLINDHQPFERRVSQTLTPTDFVPLPKGNYVLRFKTRQKGGFSTLKVFAESGGKRVEKALPEPAETWQEVTLPVRVDGRKVRYGFEAVGDADAWCIEDDISLKRK